jgi:D-psicose/D-tagatose/L-ribulose 3-epimerase
MKFGVHAFIWGENYGPAVEAVLPAISEHGFDGVEIPIFRAADFPAAAIRRGLDRTGLECTVSAVLLPGLSMLSGDAAVRRATQTHLEECVQAAASVGSRLLAGPLYSPVGYLPGRRRTGDEWKWAVEGFQALGPVLAAHDVTLAIEPLNRFETYFLNTAADGVALAREVDHGNVGVLFDTFHANIEEKDVAAACRQAGRWVKHVHTCENDRGTPGTGHVDWDGVFQALREIQYDGWLTIESFGFAVGGISAAASIWRDLAPTADSIAFDGVRFLKRQAAPERLS